jgi:multidrug efflux pump
MVSLGTLASMREIGGPIFVYRYNSRAATSITGNLRPGVSSGNVIAEVDRLSAETLPLSMKTEWTELMFMQIRDGDTTLYVFSLAVMCVFLALSALYESWALPLAVILVVPLCLLSSVTGVLASHGVVDIFVQIGLVVLVGLACKNSILIVEFARDLHQGEGRPRYEATVEASRLRLRPILMTSFAFILGVVPLVIASGAGSEMRQSLGTAVFSGMIGVTLIGIFLTPVFFYVIQGFSEMRFFTAVTAQAIVSSLFGGLSGAAIGFLLSRLGVVRWPWSIAVGAGLGILVGLAVFGLHYRIKPRKKVSP